MDNKHIFNCLTFASVEFICLWQSYSHVIHLSFSPTVDPFVDSWEKDVVGMVEQKHGKNKILLSFECETLKADKAAEDHIKQFMPKLAGMDAVGM